jgi:hypothetical protein
MGLNNHPHVDWLIARYDLSNMISMWRYVHDVSHWLTLGKNRRRAARSGL